MTAGPSVASRRALLLSPIPPALTGNGLAIRAGVALEALARHFEVDLVWVPVYAGHQGVGEWARRLARRVHVLDERVSDPFLRVVGRIATPAERRRALVGYPRPYAARFCTPEAAARLAEYGGEVDLLYAFRLYLAPLAEAVLDRVPGARLVVDIDEDDAKMSRQLGALHRRGGDDDAAAVCDADGAKFARLASIWLPCADLALAASVAELEWCAEQCPAVPRAALPNATPVVAMAAPVPPIDLLFVGNLGYLPNVEAAHWLCREVAPRVRARVGRRVRVGIVGSTPERSVLALAAETDVVVVPDALSVTPWYGATRIVVVPLLAAGGTRIKILEAFAHGRAVVSTSVGAAGLAVEDGVHLLLADGAEGFARACARLLDDDPLRRALVDAAEPVAAAHARAHVVSRLAGLLESLPAPAGARPRLG